MNEVERAVYDMVRKQPLLPPTREEIYAAFRGTYRRVEVQSAIHSLCRRAMLRRHDGGVYRVDWWHDPS